MDRTLFGSLLANRAVSACLCGAAALQLGLRVFGAGGWPCPFLLAFGLPCPGCGLSRAAVILLSGDLRRALTLHAFAPFFVAVLTLLFIATVLGPQERARAAEWVGRIEQRTGISLWLLGALLAYWALRLALDGPQFVSLVR
jgi:hypothetical protein